MEIMEHNLREITREGEIISRMARKVISSRNNRQKEPEKYRKWANIVLSLDCKDGSR